MSHIGKITKTKVDACTPDATREYMVWDAELKGFGLRVFPSGKKTYFIQYRVGKRTRRLKLGLHGTLTPDEARKLAKKELGTLAHGKDPAYERKRLKDSLSVSQLCDRYLTDGCSAKKPSTLATDRGRIERHIKPLLGHLTAQSVTRADVEKFLKDVAIGKSSVDIRTKPHGRARVRGGKGTATRTVGLLGAIFTFAEKAGLRTDNPVRGVQRYADRRCERFLDQDELARLGEATREVELDGVCPSITGAIRFLALTGCRRGEVLNLRWGDVDHRSGCLILPDSKTGHKIVALGQVALDELKRLGGGEPKDFVFIDQGGDRTKRLQKVWEHVRTSAGLEDVRLHDLRHTFVSEGVSSGLSLTVMGTLVGHRANETTARYAHLAKGAINIAADKVSSTIAEAMCHERADTQRHGTSGERGEDAGRRAQEKPAEH